MHLQLLLLAEGPLLEELLALLVQYPGDIGSLDTGRKGPAAPQAEDLHRGAENNQRRADFRFPCFLEAAKKIRTNLFPSLAWGAVYIESIYTC